MNFEFNKAKKNKTLYLYVFESCISGHKTEDRNLKFKFFLKFQDCLFKNHINNKKKKKKDKKIRNIPDNFIQWLSNLWLPNSTDLIHWIFC